jgi:hypothetical protein
VLSGRSVCLSAGGGLTLFVAVDQLGLTDCGLCRPSPTEDRRRDLTGAWQRPN